MSPIRKIKLSKLCRVAVGLVLLFAVLVFGQTACNNSNTPQGKDAVPAPNPGSAGSKTGTSTDSLLSGNVPSEVYIPDPDSNSVNNRPAFDRFSWQTFIALCWPVTEGKRGVPLNPNDPNTFLNMTNSTPVVWTTYKNQWDLFGQGSQTPSSWDTWTDPVNVCGGSDSSVKHVFGSAKSNMLPGEGDESFSVPLVDQHKNYALFEIKYNEPQYNFVVNNGLYLNKNLYKYQKSHGGAVNMPVSTATGQGAILVKASWKQLTDQDDTTRYYVINEMVYNPVTQSCTRQRMGLIGLHIAQKVDSFPQWVWSSFEQVDNVPGPTARKPYSFNNGTDLPSTSNHGFANKPNSSALIPNPAARTPVQVVRLNEIPTTPANNSTVDMNKLYQAAVGKTWLRYYQLVITQWPSNPGQFRQYTQNGMYPQDCGAAFPVANCVNTTMETYFQSLNDASGAGGGAGGNSCMGCHYTAPNTDFSWSLQLRSH